MTPVPGNPPAHRGAAPGDAGGAGLNPAGASSETIRRGEELYRILAEQLPNVAVLVFDAELCLLLAVGEALMTYGVSAPDAEGRLVSEVMAPGMYAGLESLCRAVLDGERREAEQTSANGRHHFRVFGRPLTSNDGRVWAGLVLAQDVSDLRARETELREETQRLAHLAHHDELTRLANRALFRDRLEQALSRAQRDGHEVAVVFIDVDRFKNVNDSLGHEAGDQLLQAVAEQLRSRTRAGDTVARLGGDEFAVIVEGAEDDDAIAHALDRILMAFEDPVGIDGEELLVRISVGVACGPRDGATADALVGAADRAMYQAKEAGGSTHRFYDSTMQERSHERLRLEAELHHALRRDELTLHYQPAIDLRTGRVIAVEALVRWNHPTRGLLAPLEFVPLAEQTGQAAEITEWVLDRACAQAAGWLAAGVPPFRVSVNSCSREVSGGLDRLVFDALARAGVSVDSLEIEITERFLGENDTVADDMLSALEALGVSIAVDDFGTGYSSLLRLSTFPVDVIKIDRSFVAELEKTPAVTDTIIALGRNLGLTVIAEGVETEAQHEWLVKAGCDAAAGFLYSPPRPPEELTLWLLERAENASRG